MNLEVANRLVELRKKKGYSQEELAELLGISRQAVSKWETGESLPDTENLMMLSKIYGVLIDTLLGNGEVCFESIRVDSSMRRKETFEEEELRDYLKFKTKFSMAIGLGVGLILLGVATTFWLASEWALGGAVVVAVLAFILTGMLSEKYDKLVKEKILSKEQRVEIKKIYDQKRIKFIISMFVGFIILAIGVVAMIISDEFGGKFKDPIMGFAFIPIAFAVSTFIISGINKDKYSILLKIDGYDESENSIENKVYGAVAAILFPLAAAYYLFMGFMHDGWSTHWIIFPIVGIIYGAFSGAYAIITGKKE